LTSKELVNPYGKWWKTMGKTWKIGMIATPEIWLIGDNQRIKHRWNLG
jgi:hypothetical protein